MSSDIGKRLKQLRLAAGYETQNALAQAMGIGVTTYANHENGTRGLTADAAERYSRFFKVNLDWLFTGKGEARPRKPPGVPLIGTVGAGSTVEPVGDVSYAAPIEMLSLPDGPDIGALIVKGDSQMPRYAHGEIVLYNTRPVLPQEVLGQFAIVDTLDGRRMIKRIVREHGSITLKSLNASDEKRAAILCCYRIVGTLTS
jgi:phage repressor protein C with HTH and peptisase S24 domain